MPDTEFPFWNYDIWNLNQPTDATAVIGYENISPKLRSDMQLTVGKYRFTIGNPAKDSINVDWEPIRSYAQVYSSDGNVKSKAFDVEKVKYDTLNNKVYVDIHIIENPIPLIVIWGAVITVVLITGAITTDSILESVETLFSGTIDKSPVAIGLLLIFLIPVLISAYKVFKK